MSDQPMTYAGTGVNYAALDPTKVNAQELGRTTAHYLERFGYREVSESRGESVYLMEADDHYLAFVLEGLGTKNLIADIMWHVLGRRFDGKYARDALAMILNDLITSGALPMVVGQYLALGSDRWLKNPERSGELAIGWTEGCHEAKVTYGPGETPILRDIIFPAAADLAGASIGMIKPKDCRINSADLGEGDAIILLASSGVHANGLTLIRDLADQASLSTRLPSGRMFGEAVLDPTPLYVSANDAVLTSGVRPHYAVNITGHGWRKIMRAIQPFVYIIDSLPKPQEIFDFIQHHALLSDEEIYGNLNMGAGFALMVARGDIDNTIAACQSVNIAAWVGGYLVKDGDRKAVILEEKNLTFEGETLAVR